MTYGTMTMSGKTFVLIPQEEFEDLFKRTPLPEYPPADADGNFPAVAASRVSIAREIITRREAVGLTQRALAIAAHVSLTTLSRIERAKITSDTPTITRIEKALKKAEGMRSSR
jgi:DNA-binding XRE family transcriptional regulator